MCRHLAYLGPPRTLTELLTDPPHGLYEQSFEPRCQEHGRVNADGFGIGWWDGDVGPYRYRRAVPIWADANLAELASRVRTGAAMGTVRDATTGSVLDEASVAPYRSGGHLFSHNGVVPGWRRLPEDVDTSLSGSELLDLESLSDSALLWAMIAARLHDGQPVDKAVETVIGLVAAARPEARLNLLVMDSSEIVATRLGDSLMCRRGDDWVRVASEPTDDEEGWRAIPQRHLVRATATTVEVRALALADELMT